MKSALFMFTLLAITGFSIQSEAQQQRRQAAPASNYNNAPAQTYDDGVRGRGNTGRGGRAAYGMAGCGLGSMVFKENTKMQILAATTNGTSGNQTFGITFGTSNCEAGGSMASREQVESFIAANTESLQNDIARGDGETLNGLKDLMGGSADFNTQLKTNYSKIFASKDQSAKEITQNLYTVLN
jgi:hypothetical protein